MCGIEYTNEMDLFLQEKKSQSHKVTYAEITREFNEKFGTNQSEDAIAQHCHKVGIASRYYTDEQKQWIKDHFYVEGHVMTKLFNKKFGTNRDYLSIRNQRQRLHAHRNKRYKL